MHWKQYVFKLLWFVGLLVLVFAALHVEASVKRHVDATFHVTAQFWTTACVPFILGLYFGLLFIRPMPSVNLPLLLCIFLPAFMLSFYPSIVVTIASMQSHNGSFTAPVRLWMMKLVSNGLCTDSCRDNVDGWIVRRKERHEGLKMRWSRWFGLHELPENINSNDRRPINKFVTTRLRS